MEQANKIRMAIAGAALTGCAVGAIALGPAFAGAQEDTDGTTTTTVVGDDGEVTVCEPGEGRGHGRGLRLGFDAAAEAIGIEPSALLEALRDGQTMAEVAEANGVAVADVVAAMVAEANEHLAEAVADGRITQEQADERAATLEERITERVNGEFEPRGPGGRFGHRFDEN